MLPPHSLDVAINLLLLLICPDLIEEAAVRECDIIIRFLGLYQCRCQSTARTSYGSLAVQMCSMQVQGD